MLIKEGVRIQSAMAWDRVGLKEGQKGTITQTGDYWVTVKWDGMEGHPEGVTHTLWQFTQGHFIGLDEPQPEFVLGEFQAACVKFASGHWQREQPLEKGWYPTKTRVGLQGPDNYVQSDGKAAEVWEGWWWSEPRPKMPKSPDW